MWGSIHEQQDVSAALYSKLTLSPFCGFYLFYNRSLDPTKNKLARSMEQVDHGSNEYPHD